MKYYIWSIEHNAWWAPEGNGYSPTLDGAGTYDVNEARRIVARANVVSFNECMIPVSAL